MEKLYSHGVTRTKNWFLRLVTICGLFDFISHSIDPIGRKSSCAYSLTYSVQYNES